MLDWVLSYPRVPQWFAAGSQTHSMHLSKQVLMRTAAVWLAALTIAASAHAGPSSLFWGGGSGNWSTTANWSSNELGPYTVTFSGNAATFGSNTGGTLTFTQNVSLDVFYISSSGAYTFALAGNDLSVANNAFIVSAATTFDFGGGNSTLTVGSGFSTFSVEGFTVANYQAGSDVIRFGTSASGLTSTELSHIVFSGYSMGGAAQIDSNGYVTPMGVSAVPEPSTYAAIFGAMALGAVAVIRRRRATAIAQN